MPVITNEFPGIIQFFRWGLVPKWAREISIGAKMINTRCESIAEKPAFKNIFKYRRCIVLADGYYEWMAASAAPEPGTRQKLAKQPYRIYLPHNEIMLLAGLWDTWGEALHTFSIITCAPNNDVGFIHDRMPVILNHSEAKLWLSNDIAPQELMKLMKPAPEGVLQWYKVSTLVNKPVNDTEDIIAPVV
jgi:putative SOS response-associated peptidase YedK